MKQDINNVELHERTKYVLASVKVIEFNAQKVICTSPNGNTEDLEESTFNNW